MSDDGFLAVEQDADEALDDRSVVSACAVGDCQAESWPFIAGDWPNKCSDVSDWALFDVAGDLCVQRDAAPKV